MKATSMLDRATAPEAEEQDGPSLFNGVGLEVEEIILGLNVLTTKVRSLKSAFDLHESASLKAASEDICTVSSQVSILAGHLAGVVGKHLNRKPRVS